MFKLINRFLLKGGSLNNRLISLFIALLISALSISLMMIKPSVLEDVEGSFLDARFRLRGPIAPSGLVKIVTVDEKSIDALGRWPWSRDVVAALIDTLADLGAGTIGLDIIFSEPQPSSARELLAFDVWSDAEKEKLIKIDQQINPDQALITSLFMAGNVVNGQFFIPDVENKATQRLQADDERALLVSSRVAAVKSKGDDFKYYSFNSIRHNLAAIAQAGEGAGFFNQMPEPDGIVRNAPLVLEYQGEFYPSLALKTLSRYLDNAAIIIHADEYAITHITVGDLVIPTNEEGQLPINYRGPANTIESISAIDVLTGEIDASEIKDNLVLLGVTAVGVFDSHGSPFGAEFPGLEIQANVIESIVLEDAIQRTDFHILFDFITILIGCLFLAIVIPATSRTPTRILVFGTLITILLYGNYFAFANYNHWFNLWYPLMAWSGCFILLMLYQAFMVEARYSHVRSAFKHYLSPALVDQLTNNPDLLNFGGEEKELSILFSDIRSFTNLSETVTPSELSRFLQAYMDPMTDCVLKNNGTLDKYIGDAVMAIFGAPVPFATHPIDACKAALDMIKALDTIVESVPELERLFPVKCGIGVHTGTVVVGNLGSSQQFNYTVIGDAVNLASRVEGLTKNYGVDVLITEVTYLQVKDNFVCREIDRVRVKGKQEPVVLYELIAETVDVDTKMFLETWVEGLSCYRNREFEQSMTFFLQAYNMKKGDMSAQIYMDRCTHFLRHPVPADWDGVFTHTSK